MNFYDTNSFLRRLTYPLNKEEIMISSITFDYLEENDIYIPAAFDNNVLVLEYQDFMLQELSDKVPQAGFVFIPTNKIKDLAVAYACDSYLYPDETTYISDDLKMRSHANLVFGEDMIRNFED